MRSMNLLGGACLLLALVLGLFCVTQAGTAEPKAVATVVQLDDAKAYVGGAPGMVPIDAEDPVDGEDKICYFGSTTRCDLKVDKCVSKKCTDTVTKRWVPKDPILVDVGGYWVYNRSFTCPAGTVEDDQTTGAYNIVVESSDSGQVDKKDLGKLVCIKSYACDHAGQTESTGESRVDPPAGLPSTHCSQKSDGAFYCAPGYDTTQSTDKPGTTHMEQGPTGASCATDDDDDDDDGGIEPIEADEIVN